MANSYPDSLMQALKNFPADSSKISTYVNLGYYYDSKGKADSSKYFYHLAVELSKRVADKKFKGLAFYYLALFYQNTGNYPEAIKNFNIALNTYLEINRLKKIGETYNSIGVTYYYNGQYDSAIVYYNKAIPFFEKNKDILGVAQCYNNIGIMFDIKGERVRSVESYLRAVKIYESNKREDLNTGPYQNIALVYMTQKQFPQAIKNLNMAKKIAIKYKQDETLIRILNAIGACLDETNKSEEANLVFNEALTLSNKLGNKSLQAISLTNLGENYLCLKKYEEGEKVLIQCVELKKDLGNNVSLGISEIALAQAYFKNKKFDLAISSFQNGLKKVEKADYKEYQKTALEGLAASYASSKNYKDAYFNLDQFVKLNDSLLNESNKKIVAELEAKYQTEKKQAEIEILSKDKALQEVELKRKRTEFKMVVGIASVGLVLLIYVFISLRNKRKANLILEEKNIEIMRHRDEIQLQKDIVDEKQKEIVDSINYAKRIQHSLLPTEKYIERNIDELKDKNGV
jgi:tetratricopeptide (TPR) repeat protein